LVQSKHSEIMLKKKKKKVSQSYRLFLAARRVLDLTENEMTVLSVSLEFITLREE